MVGLGLRLWLGLGLGLGCGGSGSDRPNDIEPDAGPGISQAVIDGSFRGHAIYDVDGRPRFEPCGGLSAQALALADSAGGDLKAAYQELVGEPGGRLFVEVRGQVEPVDRGRLDLGPQRRLVAQHVVRASLDPEGCDEALDGVLFRALGGEPFWQVDVTTLEISLTRAGATAIVFPYAAAGDSAGVRVYSTSLPDGTTLRLALREERCVDGLSGFWFPYEATVVIDGTALSGCAAQGW